MINNQIKNNIMLRVRTIYLIKQTFQPMFLKGYAVLIAIIISIFYISVTSVIANIRNAIFDLPSFNQFFISAFSNADIAVQISLVIAILSGAWFLFDLSKSFNRFYHQA